MGTKNLFPVIYEMADLTVLDTPKRVGLIGAPAYNQRRQFLKQVVHVGLFVSIGPTLIESCKKEESVITFSVKSVILPDWSNVTDDDNEKNVIKIVFSKNIDVDSIAETIQLNPSADFAISPYYKSDSDKESKRTNTIVIHGEEGTLKKIYLKQNTQYTLTIKGSIKSSTGEQLDPNKDGSPGEDYSMTFTVTEGYNPTLTVASCTLPDWPNVTIDQSDKNQIMIEFSEKIDVNSLTNAIYVSPAIDALVYYLSDSEADYNAQIAKRLVIHGKTGSAYRIFFTPGQKYKLTIKGTVKTKDGIYLDGNDNGSPGDDFVKEFTVPENYNAFPTVSLHGPTSSMKRFEAYFDDVMDVSTVSVSILPRIKYKLSFSTDTGSFSAQHLMYISGENGKDDPLVVDPGTVLSVTISGTFKSIHNQFLDGNKDGIGGDDFYEQYTIPSDYNSSCPCQSYSSCSGYVCPCVSFTCPCQFEGCPMYGIYK
jgi:hypothetical protein